MRFLVSYLIADCKRVVAVPTADVSLIERIVDSCRADSVALTEKWRRYVGVRELPED